MSRKSGSDRDLRSLKKRGTKSAVAQENSQKSSKSAGQNSSGGGSGPKRGSVGLRIVVQLIRGKPEQVLIEEIFREYGSFKRVSITLGRAKSKIVRVNANTYSVSEGLRIAKYMHKKDFDVNGVKGKLRIAHKEGHVKLDFKEIDRYHYDFPLDQATYYGRVIQYDPKWYGRDDAYMDYEDVMTKWPSRLHNKPQYPRSSKVGQFWQENCGADFKGLSAKFEDPKKVVSKKEMDNFYYHLFNGIFDREMGCIPDRGMVYEYEANLPGFSGWVIDVSQIKANGTVMVVSYVRGGFTEKPMKVDDSDDSEGGGASSKSAVPRMTVAISEKAVEDVQARLELFAEDEPLDGFGALEWMYGMTVYREQVFYSRLNRRTKVFEILDPKNSFVSADAAPKWRDLWQSVLTDDGYRRFQTVVNDMDNNIAAKV